MLSRPAQRGAGEPLSLSNSPEPTPSPSNPRALFPSIPTPPPRPRSGSPRDAISPALSSSLRLLSGRATPTPRCEGALAGKGVSGSPEWEDGGVERGVGWRVVGWRGGEGEGYWAAGKMTVGKKGGK